MKIHLAKNQYRNASDVISSIYDFCEQHDESFINNEIQALQLRWKKCVKRKRDYVEK